jgi:transposase
VVSVFGVAQTGEFKKPTPKPCPPSAKAFCVRDNPPNSQFRKFYERGDLPVAVEHKGSKNLISWKVGYKKKSWTLPRMLFPEEVRSLKASHSPTRLH